MTNRFLEIGLGINVPDSAGGFKPADASFEISPAGAQATSTFHKVFLAADIHRAGSVRIQQGEVMLKGHPLFLGYHDPVDGKVRVLSKLKASVGLLIASNVVLYSNCFQSVSASMIYRNSPWGVSQEVLLQSALPDPQALGLSPDSRLFIATEFLDETPEPVKTDRFVYRESNPKKRASLSEPDLIDATLDFGGQLRMGLGRAFTVNRDIVGPQPQTSVRISAPVAKRFETVNNRRLLLESVEHRRVRQVLTNLPPAMGNGILTKGALGPKQSLADAIDTIIAPVEPPPSNVQVLAALQSPLTLPDGLILDYEVLNNGISDPERVLKGDTTYWVRGYYYVSQKLTIMPGTVVKYDPGAMISVSGTVDCRAKPYGMAVFTALTDGTVGEPLATPQNPPGVHAALAFDLSGVTGNTHLKHLRIAYADTAVYYSFGAENTLSHCQFQGLWVVASADYTTLRIRNCLVWNSSAVVIGYGITVDAQHLTAHQIAGFAITGNPSDLQLSLMNSLIVNCLELEDLDPNDPDSAINPAEPVFTTAIGARHYIPTTETRFRNGVSGIDPVLQDAFKRMTTDPPQVYGNHSFNTATTLPPIASRETSNFTLGYHYDALDYAIGGSHAYANVTFPAGTAVGWFRTTSGFNHAGHGLHMDDQKIVTFDGKANTPNYWVRCNAVQEGGTGIWEGGYGTGGITGWADQYAYDVTRSPEIRARFTIFSAPAAEGGHFRDDYGYLIVRATDCEFWGGALAGYILSCYLTNCLMEYAYGGQIYGWPGCEYHMRNCTWIGGTFYLNVGAPPGGVIPATVKDCAFDRTAFAVDTPYRNSSHFSYNSFITGQPYPKTPDSTDQLVAGFSWQAGPLGNYYLLENSPIIGKGSRSVIAAGLFHYTVNVNQRKEENRQQVSICYHYPAVTTPGTPNNYPPIDTNSDGTPDYLADANANGVIDTGEAPWYNALGQWTTSSAGSVHTALLPTRKVLDYGVYAHGYGPREHDIDTGTFLIRSNPEHILFCSGAAFLPNGALLVASGTMYESAAGPRNVVVYSPVQGFWTDLPIMNEGRWYPSCTTLDTGEILITTGTYSDLVGWNINRDAQAWNPVTGQYRTVGEQRIMATYPFIFPMPVGGQSGVFFAGPAWYATGWHVEDERVTRRLATSGAGQWQNETFLVNARHDNSPAVMFEPGKVLLMGGAYYKDGLGVLPDDPPKNTVEMIDMTQASPQWTVIQPMNLARVHNNGTLLADGTVLVTGGHNHPTKGDLNAFADPSDNAYYTRRPELWAPDPQNPSGGPSTWRWTLMAEGPWPGEPWPEGAACRGYHSIGLLLADGRVLTAGGNACPGQSEIFTPPYLMNAQFRPVIMSAPKRIAYNTPFTITTSLRDDIQRFTLVRLGAVTHSFNMNQQFVPLTSPSGGNGTWSVQVPSEYTQLRVPPGHYMLFAISRFGVPSKAAMVQLLPAGSRDLIMVSPADSGLVRPGPMVVAASIGNFDPASVVTFSQSTDGGTIWTDIQGTVIPEDAGHFRSIHWTPADSQPRTYHLKAKAFAGQTLLGESEAIRVTVNNFPTTTFQFNPPRYEEVPVVWGNAWDQEAWPPTGQPSAEHFYQFPLQITATGQDVAGTILKVELYLGQLRLAEQNASVPPVSSLVLQSSGFTWPIARSGLNRIQAVSRDNSQCESFTVKRVIIYGGALDTSFNPGSGANGTVYAVAIQDDGKVIIGGTFTTVNGITRNRIARLNPNGTLDTSFDPGSGANSFVLAAALQVDGKVIIGGTFTTVNGITRNRIARLNIDGTLDTSFDPPSGANSTVRAIVPLSVTVHHPEPAGMLVAGTFTSIAGQTRDRIARLNVNGTADSFNPPLINGTVVDVALASDGKVLIGGGFTTVNAVSRNGIARLNTTGSLDATFDPGTGAQIGTVSATVNSVALQADGKMLIGGTFTSVNGTTRNRIARLNVDGSVDAVFDPGIGPNGAVNSIAIQSDNSVLIGGAFTQVHGRTELNPTPIRYIARLKGDGNCYDSSFNPVNCAGMRDDSFRPAPVNHLSSYGPNNTVRSVKIQGGAWNIPNSGLVVIGGDFATYTVPTAKDPVTGNPSASVNVSGRVARIGGIGPAALPTHLHFPPDHAF